jgi:asparagine synthase (glutamine-hydrolysing)
MCGVFGIIRTTGITSNDSQVFEEIGRRLKHRGPDGDGYIRKERTLLGMHRLSIMDRNHGWQPFWSEDGQIGVLGNGEIYNAASLRVGLINRGHQIKTGSDMEVVAHLFEESGIDCVNQLRGMFALVVFDARGDQVVLIRDRLGEKPLSFVQRDDVFYFASEQTPLIKAGIVPLRLDPEVLPQYLLHGFVPEPHSIIEGVTKVPAGHALQISLLDGSTQMTQYWNPLDYVNSQELSSENLANSIKDAVVAACTSDVPVGIALSGGIDSSMIAAIASRERSELHAFTVGYDEPGFDETLYAKKFADELGIPCHITTLSTKEIADSFVEICSLRDEPITDIAGPAFAALPKAAHAAGVPVLMTGIGGDELFWGYEWVKDLALWTADHSRGHHSRLGGFRLPPKGLQGVGSWASDFGGIRRQRDLVKFMKGWSGASRIPIPLYEFQYGYRSVANSIQEICGLDASFPSPLNYSEDDPDAVSAKYLLSILSTYLRVNGLAQSDRLSMAYSIESRTPFADYQLVELVLSSSKSTDSLKRPTKSTQKDVAQGFLPEHLINRPKRGFTPPVRKWLTAIWDANPELKHANSLIAASETSPVAVRSAMARPVMRSGKVNQMAHRLATLELWLESFD